MSINPTKGLLALCAIGFLSCGSDGTNITPMDVTCTDGIKNGPESDVDCGGSCDKCADGKTCVAGSSCASGACTNGVCTAPTCTDKVKNATESDVDCGGACGTCADGKVCTAAADCVSGVCTGGICGVPTCTDKIKNGGETDVDCGGTCGICAFGKACSSSPDCGSGICTSGRCRPGSSCAELLQMRPTLQSGTYPIDPDGYGTGKAEFPVACDMTTEGGGWTRFNWVRAAYPTGLDPLGQALDQCDPTGTNCRAKLPDGITVAELLVKDVTANQYAAWKFDAANSTSTAVLAAFRDRTKACIQNGTVWAPFRNTGSRSYCGTGAEGGCDSFFYTDVTCAGKSNPGFGIELDGDTGCAAAAFKMGSTSPGCPTVGPISGAADDYGFLINSEYKQVFGELYYR